MGAFKANLPGHYRYQRRLFTHFMQDELPEQQRGIFLAGDDISFTAGWAEGAVHDRAERRVGHRPPPRRRRRPRRIPVPATCGTRSRPSSWTDAVSRGREQRRGGRGGRRG